MICNRREIVFEASYEVEHVFSAVVDSSDKDVAYRECLRCLEFELSAKQLDCYTLTPRKISFPENGKICGTQTTFPDFNAAFEYMFSHRNVDGIAPYFGSDLLGER